MKICAYFPGPGCGPTHLDCVARGGGFLWIPFKQQAHTLYQSISMSPSCIIPLYMPPFQLILRALGVVCLNDGTLLTLAKRHTCHLRVNTHCCVFRHCWRQASRSLCVCVFFFLVICFGHSNAWCAVTQQSHCHTHTHCRHTHAYASTHTLRPSSTCPNCSSRLTFSLPVFLPLSFYLSSFLYFSLWLCSLWFETKIILFPTWKQISASSEACKAENNT